MEVTEDMKAQFNNIGLIVLALALFVVAFLGLQRVDKFMQIKAVDDCGKMARLEKDNPEDGSKLLYPIGDIYKACLKDKGY